MSLRARQSGIEVTLVCEQTSLLLTWPTPVGSVRPSTTSSPTRSSTHLPGAAVIVRILAVDDTCVIEIEDHGIGIATDELGLPVRPLLPGFHRHEPPYPRGRTRSADCQEDHRRPRWRVTVSSETACRYDVPCRAPARAIRTGAAVLVTVHQSTSSRKMRCRPRCRRRPRPRGRDRVHA
jgi:hypothetical protein